MTPARKRSRAVGFTGTDDVVAHDDPFVVCCWLLTILVLFISLVLFIPVARSMPYPVT